MFDPADERSFKTDRHEVRYLLREGRGSHLMVIFSGFDPANRQRYNYVRHLEGVAPHRMYVLDNLGPRGCYYLGEGRDLFVADAVRAAIQSELERLGLGTDQLVTAGSSKGGSAACYFGLELGCTVLAGAPQYFIGEYVTKVASAVAVCRLIAGGTEPEDVAWLDNVMPEAVDGGAPGTRIHLFSSPRDDQFATHLKPMMARLEMAGIDHELTMGDYSPHRAVGEQFGPWMREQANRISGENEETSVAAALIDSKNQLLIRELAEGGRRAEELREALELQPGQLHRRLEQLRSAGLVTRTWRRQWRLTPEGYGCGLLDREPGTASAGRGAGG